MVKLNQNIAQLQSNYLFPEVQKRKREFLIRNPQADLISLSIGDTTEPIPKVITNAMHHAANKLASREGYEGYGPEKGHSKLREKIAQHLYQNKVSAQDLFINDGAKCDLGRLQMFFGQDVKVALQDPAYPVYLDGSVIAGQSGTYIAQENRYENLVLMACTPENNFFPSLENLPKVDLIYFCSPHNPTGAVATKEELKRLVDYAKRNKAFIVFDSAYSFYIQDKNLPKSIYEIEGADEVAIEIGSFSKLAGFTGVRLGWTVIPDKLRFEDGSSVQELWHRFISTIYNGASNIAQYGGLACLSDEGREELAKTLSFYLENTRILKEAIDQKFETFSNINAPYIWARCGEQDSWHYFNTFLEKLHLITVPGSGFGLSGNTFMRFSSFGSRKNIEKAAARLLTL